ncbi:tetratricopeptide repeat protein [Paenibacillus sp. ACRRX]|uniref:tetratricopeptide repeat protein n=1 Tax=Paenibacillus sp. ACRRX TaxID=2918206 RepID=UPI001EF6C575|nr:tetratricopeptide repeat protein [Paenibacillus sp. ACRRX]MCG7408831.1 tetratricopeptide repeat protein [Paenibacillus sp. ACRRX]
MAEQKSESAGPILNTQSAIIAFPVDAAAYADRAMKALERLHYDKALKYFRRAADSEPANPVHQCNLAGALAETGQFEQSNRILEHVIEQLDPDMTECYYYMANNWAYLDNFNTAEVLLERYLTLEPYGMYAEEAEEMLEMLRFEMRSSHSFPRGRTGSAHKAGMNLGDNAESPTEDLKQADPSSITQVGNWNSLQGNQAEDLMSASAHTTEQEQTDLNGESPLSEEDNDMDEQERDHSMARVLLEEGRFAEAEQLLLHILQGDPEFLAARNNLALAYYYMGRFDEARSELEGVLDRDGGNLHALCNLAIFERHAGHEDKVQLLIGMLTKTEPFHREHAFKLATTMGILGEHAEAYRHLKRIVTKSSMREPSVYHYAAVAACHVERYDEAARWWASCRRLDPQSGIATYYLEQLQQARPGEAWQVMPSYHYRLPYDEASRRHRHAAQVSDTTSTWNEDTEGGTEAGWEQQVKTDPLVRSSLFWALRFGELEIKLQALEAMSLLGDDEAKGALRALLTDREQETYVKQLCLYVLRRMGVQESLDVLIGDETIHVSSAYLLQGPPEWQPEWQLVINMLRDQMGDHYELFIIHDAEVLWVQFIDAMYPDTPRMLKPDAWAAAIEYVTGKLHDKKVSFQDVANRYGVTAATVSKYVKRIEELCPAHHNWKKIHSLSGHKPLQ